MAEAKDDIDNELTDIVEDIDTVPHVEMRAATVGRKKKKSSNRHRGGTTFGRRFLGKFRHPTDSSSDSEDDISVSISVNTTASQSILKEHAEFERTYAMMVGIRTVLGQVYSSAPKEELDFGDFINVFKYRFPASGSKDTPPHRARNFKFKDYHPEVFREIREHWNLDPVDYTLNITDYHYLEFISNSKSGQFFFFTHDQQFMIKTMSKTECKFIRRILPRYYSYIKTHPDSLMTRFYGLHRVKPHKEVTSRFLIMGSVFYTDKFIMETYDLKGSTLGRKATAEERKQDVPVLKDLDFVENKIRIRIGREKGMLLMEQLKKDAEFMASQNIMDYSLLVGIHYMDRVEDDPTVTDEVSDKISFETEEQARERELRSNFKKRQSHYGLSPHHEVKKNPRFKFHSENPDDKARLPSQPRIPQEAVFKSDSGGIRGVMADGVTPSNTVYYLGIIDILQTYNTKKHAEHLFKGLIHDGVRPILVGLLYSNIFLGCHFFSECSKVRREVCRVHSKGNRFRRPCIFCRTNTIIS